MYKFKIKSPLRYPGGKSKALNKILPYFESLEFNEFREPFVGGGSVFIALKQIKPDAKYWINDLNYDLFCFWNQVKKNVDELVKEVSFIKDTHKNGRRLYKELTLPESSTRYRSEFDRAVRFYILNRITYSGASDSGGFSLEAFEKRFTMSKIMKLKPLSSLLQGVEITNESYETLLANGGNKVVIFMDPPYWKTMKEGLYGKNGHLHKSFDHKKFADDVKICQHEWLITYDDSDIIHNLFNFATITPWKLRYGMTNVNGKKTTRGGELFITNL